MNNLSKYSDKQLKNCRVVILTLGTILIFLSILLLFVDAIWGFIFLILGVIEIRVTNMYKTELERRASKNTQTLDVVQSETKADNHNEYSDSSLKETNTKTPKSRTLKEDSVNFMYDFTAIDFETANNNMDSACSVGLVAVKDLEIVKKDYFLIKPPTDHFRHENVEIHGITLADVKYCDNFPGVYQIIKDYIENSNFLVAHNAQFDMSVLYACLVKYNIEKPEFKYFDTINLSAPVRKDCGNSLSDCAEYFSIINDSHHNALSDAITCAKIVLASISASRFKSIYTYINGYSRIKQKVFSELKPNTQIVRRTGQFPTNVKISDLKTEKTEFNSSHPLYGKSCVFTGELQTTNRKDAMQKVLDVGGMVKSTVSSKTNYLIVGIQDKTIVGDDGLSNKEEKAYSLIQQGHDIKIINENEFLELFE